MSLPSGFLPRKYSSRMPGFATGSKVGFGMKRLILPPTSRRFLPSTIAHCMQRFWSFFGTWRMKASSAS